MKILKIKKINKLNHLIKNTLIEKKTLNRLKNYSSTTNSLSKAFLKAKYQNNDYEMNKLFEELNSYKLSLLSSKEIVDYSIFNTKNKTISEISKSASSRKKWCEFYYILSKEIDAKNILEIGTNLGVSGQYFLKAINENANSQCFFLSFEGVPDLCKIAEDRFNEIAKNNFKIIQGFYDDTLSIVEKIDKKYDLIFIDGNHRYEPTLKYFNYLKKYCHENSIIIFDDINWSSEMVNVWKKIKSSENVLSIDFFNIGMITFNNKTNLNKNFSLFYSP